METSIPHILPRYTLSPQSHVVLIGTDRIGGWGVGMSWGGGGGVWVHTSYLLTQAKQVTWIMDTVLASRASGCLFGHPKP